MSQGWRNALWIVCLCWSLACSKPEAPAKNSANDGQSHATDSGNSSSGPKLLPPDPSDTADDAGTARVTDKSSKPRSSVGLDDTNPFKDAAKNSPIEQGTPRKSLAGRWILVLTQSVQVPSGQETSIDFQTGIVVVSAAKGDDADGLTAKWTAPTEVLPPSKLVSSEVNDKQIRLTFDVNSGTKLDFQGTLKNGVVFGNAMFGVGDCQPARLLPTKEESLDGFELRPEPVDSRALGQAFSLQDIKSALKALKKFVTDRPESPLGMKAWEGRIRGSTFVDTPSEDLEQLIAEYDEAMALWGSRLQQAAKVNVAGILAQTKYNPEFSLKFVSAADKALTDESLKDLKEPLKLAREMILTLLALKNIESDDTSRAEKAFGFLSKMRDKNPFDPIVLHSLARYQEQTKQTDEAMSLYAEIASLPMLEGFLQRDWEQKPDAPKRELPSAQLVKLWKAKHGNTDNLDEFKDEVYRQRVLAFADKPSSEAPSGNKLILCELFTGSSCPPCVAADIATGGLEVTYPKTQVVVLRYHEHIPGPDPLTNADNEDRFSNYYHLGSTPTVLLNGASISRVGGYLWDAPNVYRGLKTLVDQQLAQNVEIKVRVNARVVDDNLQIVADVQGLDQLKEEAKDVRLQVVVAEDEVHFLARNGVRIHEMIVRRMVGGPGGAEPKDGKLSIKESIPLSELKASLAKYLQKYEDSEGIDFPAKPLDLKRLHVVAFAQNDESHEVLQTSAVAVGANASAASPVITPAGGKAAAKKTSQEE